MSSWYHISHELSRTIQVPWWWYIV